MQRPPHVGTVHTTWDELGSPAAERQFRAVRAFSLQKLCTAERGAEPFPTLLVPKFLPSGLAAALEACWPFEHMEPMPASRTGNPHAHRSRRLFRLHRESIGALEPQSRFLWSLFHRLIVELTPSLLAAFPSAPLGQRVAGTEGIRISPRIDLWADHNGYRVLPHTEAPHKFANFLLYLSSDPAHRGEGTSIYLPKDAGFRCWKGRQLPRQLFRLRSTVPYRSNLLFGFRKTDASFHGKEPVEFHSAQPRLTVGISIQASEHYVS